MFSLLKFLQYYFYGHSAKDFCAVLFPDLAIQQWSKFGHQFLGVSWPADPETIDVWIDDVLHPQNHQKQTGKGYSFIGKNYRFI